MRTVINRYTGRRVYVPCGCCAACRQRKADKRAARIRNNSCFGYVPLFVTLTYKPKFVPYILRQDLEDFNTFYELECMSRSDFNPNDYAINIHVRRDASFRYYKKSEHIDLHPEKVIDTFDMPFYAIKAGFYDNVMSLNKHKSDAIGVCYYKDLQDFFKRLRINLQRIYNYNEKFSYYACSEYGPITHRPHFHLLLFVRNNDVELFTDAIIRSWRFANCLRTRKFIEIARDAASYVASYVNFTSSCASFFEATPFKMSHSYSQGFGVSCECFSLCSILKKLDRGSLDYSYKTFRDGTECNVTVPLPKYVISRYFPKIKGHFLVVDAALRKLLLHPEELAEYINTGAYQVDRHIEQRYRLIHWSKDDVRMWHIRVWNIYNNHFKPLGWSVQDFIERYPDLYCRVWNCYFSTCLRMSFENIHDISDYGQHYTNFFDFLDDKNPVHSDLQYLLSDDEICWDYNENLSNIHHTKELSEKFYKHDKNRKVVNSVLGHKYNF